MSNLLQKTPLISDFQSQQGISGGGGGGGGGEFELNIAAFIYKKLMQSGSSAIMVYLVLLLLSSGMEWTTIILYLVKMFCEQYYENYWLTTIGEPIFHMLYILCPLITQRKFMDMGTLTQMSMNSGGAVLPNPPGHRTDKQSVNKTQFKFCCCFYLTHLREMRLFTSLKLAPQVIDLSLTIALIIFGVFWYHLSHQCVRKFRYGGQCDI